MSRCFVYVHLYTVCIITASAAVAHVQYIYKYTIGKSEIKKKLHKMNQNECVQILSTAAL